VYLINSDWWESGSVSGTGPLHAMNPVRVDFIRKHVARTMQRSHLFETQQLKGLRILDVGCGGGLLSESLARLGANVTSIDPSAENIRVASQHSKLDPLTATINYKQTTIGIWIVYLFVNLFII
jgi:ubiquinone biosynthesis O-methyltransferase